MLLTERNLTGFRRKKDKKNPTFIQYKLNHFPFYSLERPISITQGITAI